MNGFIDSVSALAECQSNGVLWLQIKACIRRAVRNLPNVKGCITRPLGVELDLEALLRMDEGKRAEVATKLVGGGVETPNEGRLRFNRPPLEGGNTVYMQQQDIPLEQARLNVVQRPDVTQEPALSEEDQAAINEAKAFFATQKAIAAMRKTMEQAHV